MRNYTTQMDAARKGIVTPEIEIVAKKENMRYKKTGPEFLFQTCFSYLITKS